MRPLFLKRYSYTFLIHLSLWKCGNLPLVIHSFSFWLILDGLLIAGGKGLLFFMLELEFSEKNQ